MTQPSRFALLLRRWGPPSLAAAAALGLALYYFWSSLVQGPFLLSLDDAYRQVAMAANLADTGVLGLNPGKEGAAGSSPLWTMLLTIAGLLKLDVEIAALIFSLISLLLAVLVSGRIAFELLPKPYAWAALAGIGLLGQAAALSLTGMEALLAATAILFGLYLNGIGWTRRAVAVFAVGALVRPEVLLAALAALLSDIWEGLRGRTQFRNRWRAVHVPATRTLLVVTIFLAGIAVISLLAGTAPTSFLGRRWLYGLGRSLLSTHDFFDLLGFFIPQVGRRLALVIGPGGWIGWAWMTLVLLLAAAGWWRLVATPRRLGRAFAIFAPVLLLYVAIFVGHEGHYSRYLTAIWLFLPVLTLLGVRQAVALAGNEQVEMEEAERTAARKRRIGVSLALGVLLGAGFLPQMFHWVVWQQRTVEHLRRVHREMVEHVERHVPAGERVGAYDLGLLAWEGEQTVVDLAGLTDREMARALYLRRVPELLAERDVRFVVLPERRFNRPSDVQKRMSLAVQMGFEPSRLLRHEIMRITLPMWDKLGVGHMAATQVALAQLTLYELPPQKGTPSSDEVASLAVHP